MKKLTLYLLLLFCSLSVFAQKANNNNLLAKLTPENVFYKKAYYTYDFTKLTGSDGGTISNGNAGFEDQSLNNRDLAVIGTPLIETLTINGDAVNTLEDLSTNGASLQGNGGDIFNNGSFRLYFVLHTLDGQPATTWNLMGGIDTGSVGLNVFVTTAGAISIRYANSVGAWVYQAASACFENGENGLQFISITVSFEDGTIDIRNNGETIGGTFTTGAIGSATPGPGRWTNTRNIYLGTLNNAGSAVTNPNKSAILFASCIPYATSTGYTASIDDYLYTKFTRWENEIHISTESEANALRADLIDAVFNGGSLPTISPTVVSTSWSGDMHICQSADIDNYSSIDKLSFAKTDVDGYTWTNIAYVLHTNQTPNGNLIMNIQGHITDSDAAHENFMSEALLQGYDVVFVALCVASDDNVETNPGVTAQSTTGHDQIFSTGLDRVGYNAVELFLFDKFSVINYLDASYTEIYCNGISGGGWGTVMMMAMDTRISKAVGVRGGGRLRSFRDGWLAPEGDYEQGGSLFTDDRCGPRIYQMYTDISYADLFLMGTTGGRRLHATSNRWDTCCSKGLVYNYYTPELGVIAATWGGSYSHVIDSDLGNATHAYSTFDIAEIFATYDTP